MRFAFYSTASWFNLPLGMLSVCTVFEASGHRLVSIWPLEAVPCQTFSPISFILSTISKSFVSSDYSFYDIGPFTALGFDYDVF